MKVIIYFFCVFLAAVVQTILRSLLKNGVVQFIPGTFIIYFIAILCARKWCQAIDKKKK